MKKENEAFPWEIGKLVHFITLDGSPLVFYASNILWNVASPLKYLCKNKKLEKF